MGIYAPEPLKGADFVPTFAGIYGAIELRRKHNFKQLDVLAAENAAKYGVTFPDDALVSCGNN